MTVFATAGARLYIGGVVADQDVDFDTSDFSGLSWIEVGGLTNLGEVGDSSDLITANIIALGRTKKAKGTNNAGTMSVVAAADYANQGQIELRAAQKTKSNYGFRLVFNDAPSGGSPSYRLFIALVMTARYQFNEANSVMNLMASLEVNSNLVEVDAQ